MDRQRLQRGRRLRRPPVLHQIQQKRKPPLLPRRADRPRDCVPQVGIPGRSPSLFQRFDRLGQPRRPERQRRLRLRVAPSPDAENPR